MNKARQQRLDVIREQLIILDDKLIYFNKQLQTSSGNTTIELNKMIEEEILPNIQALKKEQENLM